MTMRLSAARTDGQIWAALGRSILSQERAKADLQELIIAKDSHDESRESANIAKSVAAREIDRALTAKTELATLRKALEDGIAALENQKALHARDISMQTEALAQKALDLSDERKALDSSSDELSRQIKDNDLRTLKLSADNEELNQRRVEFEAERAEVLVFHASNKDALAAARKVLGNGV